MNSQFNSTAKIYWSVQYGEFGAKMMEINNVDINGPLD